MAVASAMTIGALSYTLPFCIIALHSLKKYLKDKRNSQKKHVCYAFMSWAVSFILILTGSLLISPGMSPERIMVVTILLKLFDTINMIGMFWLFVFLTDFIKSMKKYIPLVVVHLIITLIIILVMPFDIGVVEGTEEFIKDRAEVTSLAILFFWFLWGMIIYQFLKHSKLMTSKIAVRRSQMMCAGGIFAVLAYIFTIVANIFSSIILVYFSSLCAAAAGIVFYAGFIAPDWLRRMWGKNRKINLS